jgi:superfamily I DNA/RNA helicase
MLGHRSKIYDRLGANEDGTPGVRIVATAPDLLEKEPTPQEIGEATILLAEQTNTDVSPEDKTLLEPMDSTMLNIWGVPSEYHDALQLVRTEEELLEIDPSLVPREILEKVISGLFPKNIEEIVQQPVRTAADPADINAAADGDRTLGSFLLKLDDDQLSYVARFDNARERPKGPWLLKGGPGSGKSTIALYCIQTLIRSATEQPALDGKPLRILFTTFTNALTNAAQEWVRELKVIEGGHRVDISTVHKLAMQWRPPSWENKRPAQREEDYMRDALARCKKANPKFSFSGDDADFLSSEVDWVIIGQGLKSSDEYLKYDRQGRGRALVQQQRRDVWEVFETYQRLLHKANRFLWSELTLQASQNVEPKYDYVFIDEAQDLQPAAIRFCIGLAFDSSNVFLTADTNQSIYGSGLSWSRVTKDLRFQGRARILRNNYRTTTENWGAISQLAPHGEGVDRETLDVEPVFKGPYPILARYSNRQDIRERLNSFLSDALRQERMLPECAAVLCKTRRIINETISLIDPRFNAKPMQGNKVDFRHKGVKVMTMHAAKGLQFPVVAVVGVEEGIIPKPAPIQLDDVEHKARENRLLFVACSRAMRHLIVFASRKKQSPFVDKLTDEFWEVEDDIHAHNH